MNTNLVFGIVIMGCVWLVGPDSSLIEIGAVTGGDPPCEKRSEEVDCDDCTTKQYHKYHNNGTKNAIEGAPNASDCTGVPCDGPYFQPRPDFDCEDQLPWG